MVLWFFSIFKGQIAIFFVFCGQGVGERKKDKNGAARLFCPFFATPWPQKTKTNGDLSLKNRKQTKESGQDLILLFISIDNKWKNFMFLDFYRFSSENKRNLAAHMTCLWFLPLVIIDKNEKNKNKIDKNEKNEKFLCSFGQLSDFFFAWKSIKI